jgi:hypothetical protein
MDAHDIATRRHVLVTGAAGAAVLATGRETTAQAPAQKSLVKHVPAVIFIGHAARHPERARGGPDSEKVNRLMSLANAFEKDTLLTYAFDGEPVPADHGFPVRAIVPGWVGIQQRQVGRPHRGAQRRDRRAHDHEDVRRWRPRLPEQGGAARADAQECGGPPLGRDATGRPPAPARLRLVARISRVEVSLDHDKTWQPVELREPNLPRAWTRWTSI